MVREVKIGALDASEADSETAIYAPAAQFGFNGSARWSCARRARPSR